MSRKEVERSGVVKLALDGKATNAEGAKALSVSVRQFRRLKARYRKGGGVALAHQSRGRSSSRRMSESVRTQVIDLMQRTYVGLNDSHLTEKLREQEGLSIGRETVRKLRHSAGLSTKRPRRSRQHRIRREREQREGALLQTDGSSHDWLEGRGPVMTLIDAIDDATGKILGATFRPHEDLHGYATVFQQVFTAHGLPLGIYGDGTSILVRNDDHWTIEEQLDGEQSPTHLGRALKDLSIGYIQARSPQAKGRIENHWRTLQDRLPVELRLRGISTLAQANAFLPEFIADYNQRFACAPGEAKPAWRKPPRDLDCILSCRYPRVVALDNTVSLPDHRRNERQRTPLDGLLPVPRPTTPARWIQIPPGPKRRSYARCRVDLRELLDGRLIALYNGRIIAAQPAPEDFILAPRGHSRSGRKTHSSAAAVRRKTVASAKKKPGAKLTRRPWIPPRSHPWRRVQTPRHDHLNTP